jgi:hypothetical protein
VTARQLERHDAKSRDKVAKSESVDWAMARTIIFVSGRTTRHLLTAGAFALLALPAYAQNSLPLDRIPPSGQSWHIERATDLPAPFVAALLRADCRQDDTILFTFPIELFRPSASSRPMMIVPCAGITLSGRAFLLDQDPRAEPQPLAFPMMAFPGRVSASETPGLLSWNPAAKVLVAVQGNDECDGVVARHTYRHDERRGGDNLNGFGLAKVERAKLGCFGARENWEVVWEASPPPPASPR